MEDDKWIVCYYSDVSDRLMTYEFKDLESALKIIKQIIKAYGDDVKYKIFRGKELL